MGSFPETCNDPEFLEKNLVQYMYCTSPVSYSTYGVKFLVMGIELRHER